MAAKEVTVSSTKGLTRAISEVASLLETEKEATITAINMAIPSAVNLVELIKHKIKGIYQENSFEKVKDSNKTRVVFKLSLNPLNSNHPGYQPPIQSSEVVEKSFDEIRKAPIQSTFRRSEQESKDNKDDNFVSRRPRGQWGRGRNIGNKGEFKDQKETQKNETFNKEKRSFNTSERKTEPREGFRGREQRGTRDVRGQRGQRSLRGSGFTRGQRGNRRFYGPRGGRFTTGDQSGNTFNEIGIEKYQLVKTRNDSNKQPNEIFVSAGSNPIFAVKDGLVLLKKGEKTIVLRASGLALPKAVRVAEEIKRKEPGLHQQNSFSSKLVKDLYKPIEDGLDEVIKERNIDEIEIVLSKTLIDKNHTGYQPPIDAKFVTNLSLEEVEKL